MQKVDSVRDEEGTGGVCCLISQETTMKMPSFQFIVINDFPVFYPNNNEIFLKDSKMCSKLRVIIIFNNIYELKRTIFMDDLLIYLLKIYLENI